MKPGFDGFIARSTSVPSDGPTPDFAIEILIDELKNRADQSDGEGLSVSASASRESEEELLGMCLDLLGQPQIRFRLRLLERLAWSVGIDPASHTTEEPNRRADLLYRELPYIEQTGDRIGGSAVSNSPTMIGMAQIAGQNVSLYLPTGFTGDHPNALDRFHTLPVGTVLIHALECDDLGIVDGSLIADDDGVPMCDQSSKQ